MHNGDQEYEFDGDEEVFVDTFDFYEIFPANTPTDMIGSRRGQVFVEEPL